MPTALERALAEVGGLPGGGGGATGDPLSDRLDNLAVELTSLWVLICAFFVFQVQSRWELHSLFRSWVGQCRLPGGEGSRRLRRVRPRRRRQSGQALIGP